MKVLLFALAAAIGAVEVVRAATTNATCGSDFSWADNAEGQSPCLVAADLQGVCNGGDWFVPALPAGLHYVGPPDPAAANLCICSTVVYNLISACAACQSGEWVSWSMWAQNCTTTDITRGSFPEPVPDGTSVPAWAEIDTSLEGNWDESQANSAAESNLPDVYPPSASASGSGASPSSTSGGGSSSSSGSSTPIGAIVGGVVGGVVGLGAIVGLIVYFCLRNRRRQQAIVRETADLGAGDPSLMPAPYLPADGLQGEKGFSSMYNSGTYSSSGPYSTGSPAPTSFSPPPTVPTPYTGHPESDSGAYTLYNPSNPATWPSAQTGIQSGVGYSAVTPAPTYRSTPGPGSPPPKGAYTGAAEL